MATSDETVYRKMFVSMPISDNLASDGTFRSEKRKFYKGIIDSITGLGLEVESAALNEDWPRGFTK